MVNKKAVINPKNENEEECFKWAVTIALHYKEIKSHPERVSNIVRYTNNYNWSGLEFLVAINKISEFEKNNDIAVNVLGYTKDIHMQKFKTLQSKKTLLTYY